MTEETFPHHELVEPSTDGFVGITALGLAGVMIVIMYSVMCWRHRSILARTRQDSLVVNNSRRRREGGTDHGSEMEMGSESTSKSGGVKKQDVLIQELISRELEKNGRQNGGTGKLASLQDSEKLASVQETGKLAVVQDTASNDVTSCGRDVIRTLSMNIPDTILQESLSRV
ncbi:hypothetical protein ACHWQZ_G009480 [Mnemiopsis leidyi]